MDFKGCEIYFIPDEVISLILQNSDTQTIINFGSTCKRFYQLVRGTQSLWKNQFKCTLPTEMYETAKKYCNGDWFSEIKAFHKLKSQTYKQLLAMSPKYYLKINELALEDTWKFYGIALSGNMSYYYTIYILQNLISKGNKDIEKFIAKKPFTMTEMYYAKMVLRYLIQTFLTIKWVKLHAQNELPPEVLINFFLQWIDTEHYHSDEEMKNKINELVQKVQRILKAKTDGFQKKVPRSEREILAAVTKVIYHQQRMAVMTAANLDSLDIVKVVNNKSGNDVVAAAIYQAVARQCGVQCELVSFPSHLFLEWRNTEYPHDSYTVDINNGELRKKRSCPFSHQQGQSDTRSHYYPDYLLQYIFSVFQMSMGAIKNWNTQNASYLLDFLSTENNMAYHPYKNFLPYLLDSIHLPVLQEPLDIRYLSEMQRNLITALANLNVPPVSRYREAIFKKHDSRVKYAVGMICYHKNLRYMCVIRDWEQCCAPEWTAMANDRTLLGLDQPFYHVIAVDQSDRYVAQENLLEVMRPTRIYHLEDVISREFSHFDGFAYVPNDEKKTEYPEEKYIVDVYRNRARVLYRSDDLGQTSQ